MKNSTRVKGNTTMKRFTALMIIEVKGGNPNGDPETNGSPRQLDSGHGMISAVSIKRKYRNLLEDHSNPVTKQLMDIIGIEPENSFIFESHLKGFETGGDALEAMKEVTKYAQKNGEDGIIRRYVDTRWFGVTGLEKVKKGQESLSIKRTGGISISNAVSINPVEISLDTITKTASLRDDLVAKKQGDIAPEGLKLVKHGLYVAKIVCDVKSAYNSLMSDEDVEAFRIMTPHIFNQSLSAARPAGSVQLLHFWVKYHDQATCSFNENKFWSDLAPVAISPGETSESLADYKIIHPKDAGWVDVFDWANR